MHSSFPPASTGSQQHHRRRSPRGGIVMDPSPEASASLPLPPSSYAYVQASAYSSPNARHNDRAGMERVGMERQWDPHSGGGGDPYSMASIPSGAAVVLGSRVRAAARVASRGGEDAEAAPGPPSAGPSSLRLHPGADNGHQQRPLTEKLLGEAAAAAAAAATSSAEASDLPWWATAFGPHGGQVCDGKCDSGACGKM